MRKLTHEEKRARWRSYRPPQRFPLAAVLDNLRSAYNVGSIFRTAACAHLAEVILCGITACPPHKEVEKTALGATVMIPWRHVPHTLEAVRDLKGRGWTVAALEITENSVPVQLIPPHRFPLALVVGNEVTGVDEAVLAEADLVVEIPQFGEKESLNVAVAFGIAVYLILEKCRPPLPGEVRPVPDRPAGPG
ncbi:RNA methyltransferase [Thermus sp.]|uniref:RNA methyltransferase n=1 Tax=Thermus sp. TaxID=275 RepID=UPI002637B551|nr:RNA methyltransferase [Thermus sp.]MCX7850295.1 RNA methyltransferase [Thermus sp.]